MDVASLVRSDGDFILDALAESERLNGKVESSTGDKNRKVAVAWFNWEIQRERDRAEEQKRQPLSSVNVFSRRSATYSKPRKDAAATVDDQRTRRFYPEHMAALISAAVGLWVFLIIVVRRLGLRPGEAIHIRWMDDVTPLPDGNGYEVRLEGSRRKDERCRCRQCRSEEGWAPKNGPRVYVLDRRFDAFGWIAEICDALDAWVRIRSPQRGDFFFPDPDDWSGPFTNNKLNRGLHDLAAKAGVVTGLRNRGSRTFHSLRHTCGSELLEAGVSHPHAAFWISDTLDEFMKTYGRPTPEAMARAIFGRGA